MIQKIQTIEEIRKQYDHEWLLIRVVDMDETTTTPLTGELLAHHSDPLEIHKEARQSSGTLLTVYSEDWPADVAACFYVKFF